MPIRFQVDHDFYDHPKVLGMTDAAFALWVRAGSYSAAKTSDGFIAEDALSLFSQTQQEAAGELVRRGLWRRVKGGYRFHQWDHRNLTRARVEADREADRKRKREERQQARQNAKPHQDSPIVRPESTPDSARNPTGVRPLSVSVSVSESESESGSGRGPGAVATSPPEPPGPEPPRRCPQHLEDDDPPPCGRCAEARKAHEAWERARLLADAEQRSAAARDRAIANQAAIAACDLCDRRGYRNSRVCDHDPGTADRATRGAAAARDKIRRSA